MFPGIISKSRRSLQNQLNSNEVYILRDTILKSGLLILHINNSVQPCGMQHYWVYPSVAMYVVVPYKEYMSMCVL